MTRFVAVALLVLLAAPMRADDAPDLRRLFPNEAEVFVEGTGLVRLPLSPEVLGACRPDLSDLRLFDRDEHEVPYLVDAGVPPGAAVQTTQAATATVVDAKREEMRRKTGPPVHRETYTLALPAGAPALGTWALVVETARSSFVRRLDVTLEGPDGAVTALVDNGSLFRLPNAERTSVALPARLEGRLTVTLAGEDGRYLDPSFRFEAGTALQPRERAVVRLPELGRERRAGRTVLDLDRPRGVVPDVLLVETSTGSFDRTVEVRDEGPGLDGVLLGRGTVFRVRALAEVEVREVAIGPARGQRLRVEIVDQDSAPLDDLAVFAVVRQPSLIFSLAPDGTPAAGTIRFGGGRARTPRYDLARLLPAPGAALDGERAVAAVRLFDPAQLGRARLGEVRRNPAFDGAPALLFAMRPSSTTDTRVFTHRLPVDARPSGDGLARLALSPEAAAHARADLADLRVVDTGARQWPYLIERDAARTWRDLQGEAPVRDHRTSRYRLVLPAVPMAVDQLVLESDVPFVDRAFRLTGTHADGSPTTLADGRLAQRGEQPAPLTVAFAPARVDGLELRVDDGDELPLTFHAVRVRALVSELYLAAPAGKYYLLLGDPDATAPRFELARVRDVVLAVDAGTADAGPVVANPAYSLRARVAAGERLEGAIPQIVLWSVLLGAVVVLAVLTLRLARTEQT
jgi:hypothetical protein